MSNYVITWWEVLVEGKGFVWRNVRSYGNFVGASLQIEADLGKPRPPAPQVLKTARWADARLPLEAHRLPTVISIEEFNLQWPCGCGLPRRLEHHAFVRRQ